MILNHFFIGEKDENKKLNTANFFKLMKFFESKNTLNNLLAGYVSKALEKLIYSQNFIILDFFNQHENILDNILFHCDNFSVLDKIVQNLIFKVSEDLDKSIDSLENKLDSPEFEVNNLPLKIKILNKCIQKLSIDSEDSSLKNNILKMFQTIILEENKNEELIKLIKQEFYEKENILKFFNLLVDTKKSQNFLKTAEFLSSLFLQYDELFNMKTEVENLQPLNNSDLFLTFLDFLGHLKELLEVP